MANHQGVGDSRPDVRAELEQQLEGREDVVDVYQISQHRAEGYQRKWRALNTGSLRDQAFHTTSCAREMKSTEPGVLW